MMESTIKKLLLRSLETDSSQLIVLQNKVIVNCVEKYSFDEIKESNQDTKLIIRSKAEIIVTITTDSTTLIPINVIQKGTKHPQDKIDPINKYIHRSHIVNQDVS